jgi:hypothetical protein
MQSNATTAATSSAFSFSSAFPPKSLFLQQQLPASGIGSGVSSRTRSGDTLPSLAMNSKDVSPLKQALDASTHSHSHTNLASAQNIPPEVRCMACGAMVPVHPKPCDIKPCYMNSGANQNVLASYLPEGVMSSMTLSSYGNDNDSCVNSKQMSFNMGSAFDVDDPQPSQPMAPASYSLQILPEAAETELPRTRAHQMPCRVLSSICRATL